MPQRRSRRPARGASSADLMRALVDHVADVILRVRLSPRPRLEYLNRAVESLTGYTADEVLSDQELALRLVLAADRRKLLDVARTRRVPRQPFLLRWTRRDGSVVTTEVRATPVHSRNGMLVAIDATLREVTAARVKPPAPRVQADPLADVFEHAPIALVHLALDGRLLRVNRRFVDLTGYAAAELDGKRVQDLTHPEDLQRESSVLQRLSSGELSKYVVEKRCVCKDGSPLWVRMTAAFPPGVSGAIGEGIAVIEPIAQPGTRDAGQATLSYSGIDLDTDRLEVTWNARIVPLTLKEVLLLRYLIRHRGEMLPRDRLLRDVWGYKYSGRSRTLDVHVCRLRRKLPPLATSLVTIGHFGYTLSHDALIVGGIPAGTA